MPNTLRWLAASLNKRQADTITIANTWAQNDTCTLTINNVDFVITIGTLVTTTQVATTIKEAINGTTLTDTSASCQPPISDLGAQFIPPFSELTATSSSAVVTVTANGSGSLAGKPFTLTATESTAGTGTATRAASITATSQHHASEADNWDGTNTPADGDTLIFDSGSTDLKYNLNAYQGGSTAQPAIVTVYKSFTGNIGLPQVNIDNSSKNYPEYRTRYLTFDDNTATTTFNLHVGEGSGSGRLMFDSGAGQAVVNLFGKGSRLVTGIPGVLWKGSHASNIVRNNAGDIGIAFFGGETATVATLVTGNGPTSQASCICGTGVTLTTVTCNGGTLETNSAFTTGTANSGAWVHKAGTATTITVNKGAFFYPDGAVTLTTLDINGGTVDLSKGSASVTITNTITMSAGSKFYDPQGRSGNPVIQLRDCTLADVTIITPQGKTITFS